MTTTEPEMLALGHTAECDHTFGCSPNCESLLSASDDQLSLEDLVTPHAQQGDGEIHCIVCGSVCKIMSYKGEKVCSGLHSRVRKGEITREKADHIMVGNMREDGIR